MQSLRSITGIFSPFLSASPGHASMHEPQRVHLESRNTGFLEELSFKTCPNNPHIIPNARGFGGILNPSILAAAAASPITSILLDIKPLRLAISTVVMLPAPTMSARNASSAWGFSDATILPRYLGAPAVGPSPSMPTTPSTT